MGVEEVSPLTHTCSENELCEEHFCVTHSQLPGGRFQIRQPFKKNATALANTFN